MPQKPKLEQQKPGAQTYWRSGAPHEPSVDTGRVAGCVVVDVADEVLVDVCVCVDEDVDDEVDVEVCVWVDVEVLVCVWVCVWVDVDVLVCVAVADRVTDAQRPYGTCTDAEQGTLRRRETHTHTQRERQARRARRTWQPAPQ